MELNYKKLYVSHIESFFTETMIENIFQQYGECHCILKNCENNMFEKYAFITYTNEEDAEEAKNALDKMPQLALVLDVKYARITEIDRRIAEEKRRREEERQRRQEERRRLYEEERRRREEQRRERQRLYEERKRKEQEERRKREEEQRKKREIINQLKQKERNRELQMNEVKETITYSKTSIFIKDIPIKFTEDQMKELFIDFNPLSIHFKPSKNYKTKSVVIEFESETLQFAVLTLMNEIDINGTTVYPKKAFAKDNNNLKNNDRLYPSETKVIIENFPGNYSSEYIMKLFNKYKPINITNENKMIMTFETHEMQQQAIKEMDGKIYGNKTISVKMMYDSYYEIVEKRVIQYILNDDIKKISEHCNVSEDEAIVLLQQHNWNIKETLEKEKQPTPSIQSIITEEFECPICFDTTNESIGLSCGHKFCKSCWKTHIEGNINRGIILNMKCMESGCNCIVSRNIIALTTPSLVQRYNEFMLKESVEANGNIFCPNPSCDKIIIMNRNGKKAHSIRCQCNQRFCVKCHGEYHSPTTCEELDKWNSKNQESDDSSYLMLTIKHCYHCGCPSERIEGCNHITCPQCRKEWCWMCGGDWSKHGNSTGGYFSCTIYENEKGEQYQKDQEAEKKKNDYKRYIRYFNEYINTNQKQRSLQMEKIEKMKEIEDHFKSNKEQIRQLEQSFNTLFMAKAWLKNSFIHLYYLEDNSKEMEQLKEMKMKIEIESEHLSRLLMNQVNRYNVQYIVLKATQLKEVLKSSDSDI